MTKLKVGHYYEMKSTGWDFNIEVSVCFDECDFYFTEEQTVYRLA